MALLDFLKNKKEKDKAKEKKAQNVSVVKEIKDKPASVSPKRNSSEAKKFSYQVVKAPHISEKANYLSEKNKYTFTVYNHANKPEIKKAIEGAYGVNVLSVNMVRIPHKKRRLGRTEGFKKAYHKAIVTIKEGQKIELF